MRENCPKNTFKIIVEVLFFIFSMWQMSLPEFKCQHLAMSSYLIIFSIYKIQIRNFFKRYKLLLFFERKRYKFSFIQRKVLIQFA